MPHFPNPLPLVLANAAVQTDGALTIRSKAEPDEVARTACAGPDLIEQAIAAALAAEEPMRRLPAYRRRDALLEIHDRVRDRGEEFARTLVFEVGKTLHEARAEVQRTLDTLRLAAEEATRIGGEVLPVDLSSRGEHLRCLWRRFPIGACSLFTPFNFPLNLAAHKLGPALACGCPAILKPSPQTPLTSILLGLIVGELDLPAGSVSVLPCRNEDSSALVSDPRLKLMSFTGSAAVGWSLRERSGRKKVVLELGGNAACVVERDADLELAASRIVSGAFAIAGQSCISVQRVLAQRRVVADLRARLVAKADGLPPGNPLDEQTLLGPLISEAAAQRVESWVKQAVAAGARIVRGGGRRGAFFEATIVEQVPADQPLSCEEVFGPVLTLEPFDQFDEALARVNDGPFGLQAGLFTRDIDRALHAFEALRVGGVVINDVPTVRADNMPYGGVKDSGAGREGARFAIEDMTEIRVLLVNHPQRDCNG